MNKPQDINRQLRDAARMKYYRLVRVDDEAEGHDLTENSRLLHTITGNYSDEYIVPVTELKYLFNVLSDESAFKGHYGISIVLLPILNENHNTDREECEGELESLCKEYGLSQIHFTDIIGRNSLGKLRRDFLQRYADIVSTKKAWSISFSMDRSGFIDLFSLPNITDKELYFNLFWNTMEKVAGMLPTQSVFHINFELDNNLSVTLGKEYVGKLYSGLNQCQSLKDKQDSVYKYPLFFSKKALFYSSLADLAAYSNNVLQQKLDSGIPIAKIKMNYSELIETLRCIFKQSTSLHQLGKVGAASLILGEL